MFISLSEWWLDEAPWLSLETSTQTLSGLALQPHAFPISTLDNNHHCYLSELEW